MLKEGRLNEALDQAKTQKAAEIEKGKKEAKRLTAQAQKEVEKMRAEAKAKAEEEKGVADGYQVGDCQPCPEIVRNRRHC